MKSLPQKITFLGLSLAAAMILSYIETLIPLNFLTFGFKIGLGNAVILLLLKRYSFSSALAVNLARILLSSLLFGNVTTLLLSLAGGISSLIAQALVIKIKSVGIIGVSSLGGAVHNLAQIPAAALLIGSIEIASLTPILLLLGGFTGAVMGFCVYNIENKLTRFLK